MTKTRRPSRRRTPWPRLGKPIERPLSRPYSNKEYEEWSEGLARKWQYERMLQIKKHYGIEGERGWEPWYNLVVAIVSEFDDGLKIVDTKVPNKPRWKGADGYSLVKLVEVIQAEDRTRSERDCLGILIRENRWFGQFSVDTLSVRLAEAKRHHCRRSDG